MVDDIFISRFLITENHSESDVSENSKFVYQFQQNDLNVMLC